MPFDSAIVFVLRHEGGFVHDPDDPGGATNHGITQKVYDADRVARGQPLQGVNAITDDEVRMIYRNQYWLAARCDKLPAPLDLVHFDTAVNCGVDRANRMLQQSLGALVDGVVGPSTIAAAQAYDRWQAIARYVNCRISWYAYRVTVSAPSAKFLHGWLRRVGDLLSTM